MRLKISDKMHSANRLVLYLLLIAVLSLFCFLTLDLWLLPYSIAHAETGKITAGYLLYAAIGIVFSTPGPFWAVLVISLVKDRISLKQMLRNIFKTEKPVHTVVITGAFCAFSLVYALLFGTPNGSPWYLFPLGFLIMIPFVGIAEETGWRGLLQPELDKWMSFPWSVLLTAAIWWVWHFSLWLDPTSNHYTDSIIGFGITIFIWAFALAAIYKATKSIIACAVYHAFIDAIGAVYDWNALFDAFPGSLQVNLYRLIWLAAAIVLWVVSDRKQNQEKAEMVSKNRHCKRKTVRILIMVILSVIAVLFMTFGAWVIRSSGKIRQYDDEKSLSEKFVMDINGAPNGFFINSRNTENPVLLFISSGPGTDDYVFTDRYEDMNLEDDFTIVYLDYRWMGIAYDKSIDPDQITLENLLSDTHAVTGYLKDRFGKEKIYIMGFSGGTHLALRAAERYPEDYIAMIGMAQCVTDSAECDTIMYSFMKDVFTERNDRKSLRKLEASVDTLPDGSVKCRDWLAYVNLLHDAGGGTIKDKTEFEGITLPIILSRCYTIKEKIGYVKGMNVYLKTRTPLKEALENFDYRREIPELQIPAYFISGDTDYNCPWPLVEEYCSILQAPDKDFFLVPDAAHSPLWENPEVTCGIMRQIKKATAER